MLIIVCILLLVVVDIVVVVVKITKLLHRGVQDCPNGCEDVRLEEPVRSSHLNDLPLYEDDEFIQDLEVLDGEW